jgi:diguanylate cyclase (GGDEF)-like protein
MIDYQKLAEKKVRLVYEFQTLNSAIKNSTMYLASLINDLPKINVYKFKKNQDYDNLKKHISYSENVIRVVSNIFLAKSAFDKDFINKLNKDVKYFSSYKTSDRDTRQFNSVFLAHMKIFQNYFPMFISVLKQITDKRSIELLDEIYNNYFKIMNNKLIIIKWVSFALILFVVVSVSVILFLLKRLEREYINLQRINNELHLSYITDKLTGLYNRNKFDSDVKMLSKPVLVLVNIDNFKNINDYYGSKTGDTVLKKTADIVSAILPDETKASVYRLGADDFGILYELPNYPKVIKLVHKIIDYFDNNEITVDDIRLNISVSAGISTKKPLLENADIALKYVKRSYRKKYMFYEENMDMREEIEKNIEKSRILYKAIQESRIEPYFQPIVDTRSGKIEKYEVLARLIHENGQAESIFPYLKIAKDNKLYAEITKTILQKTFDFIENRDISISINISVEDILDMGILKLMFSLYLKNRDIAKKVTFEMLESEAVEDYYKISRFLQKVKNFGSKIAIDDFGSGYSNFEHLLNLNVDYIKIDGSLIKKLEKNNNAYKIVKVIVEFAKDIEMKTVAEFVENEKIYKVVKELGIDYCQGYYFYKPMSKNDIFITTS